MNELKLTGILRVLDPSTSVEIVDERAGRGGIYRGLLLNLPYYEVGKMLDWNVKEIRMRNEEHGYCVVIKLS